MRDDVEQGRFFFCPGSFLVILHENFLFVGHVLDQVVVREVPSNEDCPLVINVDHVEDGVSLAGPELIWQVCCFAGFRFEGNNVEGYSCTKK